MDIRFHPTLDVELIQEFSFLAAAPFYLYGLIDI